ncbi:hypothetical protein ASG89_15595 [Paenibacillus sp. Soil766]|uniref:hypothetical protein n=1 Tax=Paenibacillus sp. Soil766 TaxID=1736404 RepID=UPI0007097E09|nr:hypothetical protein [Paenibacillus sp. Soil766]KRF09640.1 hypothetical protein ASG89_15595 [Paenibacillus sp. Soil766]
MQKVYNLFLDSVNEFSICEYTFVKVENYEDVKNSGYKRHEIIEQDTFDSKGWFFVGDYICLEIETLEDWNKYSGDQLELKGSFRNVILKIEHILTTISSQNVKANKLDKLIFFYIEMQKNAYLDTKIALLGPLINILIDLNASNVSNDEVTMKIEMLNNLKNKVNQDANYSPEERESISIGITKFSSSLGSDFTDRTIHFLKSHEFISSSHNIENFDEKVQYYAQLINALRNGILHSGNLRASGIERKFKNARLPTDESTFTSKLTQSKTLFCVLTGFLFGRIEGKGI